MKVNNFINSLFSSRDNAHIAHLQTTSFAQHMAFGELYDGIVDLADKYAETYQGMYGIISGYGDVKVSEGVDMSKFLQEHAEAYRAYRETVQESELQQQVDNVIEFLNTIIYKLTFLK